MKHLFTMLGVYILSSFALYGQTIDYHTNVQPILTRSCIGNGFCHINSTTSGVNLTNYASVMASVGSQYGTLIVHPNDTATSPLYNKISRANPLYGLQMPRTGAYLTPQQLDTIARWIMQGATLPVELIRFSGKFNNGNVLLQWETASEVGNHGFEIQRRKANTEWEVVDFKEGFGTSNHAHEYSYTDASKIFGKQSYRLKQIDNDGKFTFSNTIEFNVLPTECGLQKNYPNPFNPSTTISFVVPATQFAQLRVYNINGQELQTLFSGTAEGNTLYSFQFTGNNLSSGIYFYTLDYGGKSEVHKMLLAK